MKTLLARTAMLTLIAAFCASTVLAAEVKQQKIGVVNVERVVYESETGKAVFKELDTMADQKQAIINEKLKTRDILKKALAEQQSALSEEAVRQRADEIEKIERDLDRFMADAKDELQKLEREKRLGILKEAGDVIFAMGKEMGFSLIIPSGVVIYNEDAIDITDMVIKKFDEVKGKTAKPKAPAAAAPKGK